MSETINNLPILREENVQMIVKSAPDAYNSNALSANNCANYGEKLLVEIKQHGMSDELDKRCADYIDKAKRTLKAMNERRAPLTKLFDQIRSEFTGMENTVDSTKKDTVPYQIQQARNTYAAKKHEEAERKRQEEVRRQQHEAAIKRYQQEAEDDFRRQFDRKVSDDIETLNNLNRSLSVENFEEVSAKIKNFNDKLGNEWFQQCKPNVHKPYEITDEEASQMRKDILNRLSKQLKEQYASEVGVYRDTIADALPSKKRELERIAQAAPQEQKQMEAGLEAREAAALAKLDEERIKKKDEENAAKQVQQTATEMSNLFGQVSVAATTAYQPKTSVRKQIVVDAADGILVVISTWWSKEGQFMSLEELNKTFKKQITFCNKLANDKNNPELIDSQFVHYEEEVKAK